MTENPPTPFDQEWISVRDRLPDPWKLSAVIVTSIRLEDGAILRDLTVAARMGDHWATMGGQIVDLSNEFVRNEVTHWAHIPYLPKGVSFTEPGSS